MIIVLLGPPGSGKGTQAKLIVDKLNLPHIAMGDMLREAVKNKTEIGQRADAFLSAGKLVPNEITIGLTEERVTKEDCNKGFLLDGFPRNMAQALALTEIFEKLKLGLDKVLYIAVPLEDVVERLSGRLSCGKCGAVFHGKFSPPKKQNICDSCGEVLYQRNDDKKEVIKNRFVVYQEQTKPLLEYYKDKIVEINGQQSADKVFAEICQVLGIS